MPQNKVHHPPCFDLTSNINENCFGKSAYVRPRSKIIHSTRISEAKLYYLQNSSRVKLVNLRHVEIRLTWSNSNKEKSIAF